MSFEMDNEILQDFLVEAGEILEKLGEQLVDLEHRPTDKELLNAVFRGFHTVKGGAGFLNITPLVEVCHSAEDVFNLLRQGQRMVDADLMDVVLRVTDVVNSMMNSVREGQLPEPAEPALLDRLRALAVPQAQGVQEAAVAEKDAGLKDGATGRQQMDAVEEKFEELLGVSEAKASAVAAAAPADSGKKESAAKPGDEITDAEFEALLDQLHGAKSPSAAAPRAEASTGQAETMAAAAINAAPLAKIGAGVVAPQGNSPSIKEDDHGEMKKAAPAKEAAAQPQAETTVRVDTKRLDDIMNLVGELVLVRNRLETLKLNMGNDDVAQAVSNLDVVTSDLQTAVMKTRMQPIKKVFGRFPRVVRDLARTLNKEIALELIGEDTDLDKNMVEALADPLVHLVRNAVDHGIEMPDVRQQAGKPRTGTVILSAKQEGDHILLVIKDDGAGMNADKLRRKAVEKGMMDEDAAARLSERECYNLIFMPGFSMKAEISDISGRGVGMDVVKTRITQLNGNVEIDSQEGRGSEIKIKLPLTLAIVPTLMVLVGKQIFAIPLANVSEIIQYESIKRNVIDGLPVAVVRDHPLPLFYLRNWLLRDGGGDTPASQSSYIVVIKIGPFQTACVVDYLIAQEEVVIKPLGAMLHGLPGLSGATITGDGRIAIILDMPSLIARYAGRLH